MRIYVRWGNDGLCNSTSELALCLNSIPVKLNLGEETWERSRVRFQRLVLGNCSSHRDPRRPHHTAFWLAIILVFFLPTSTPFYPHT